MTEFASARAVIQLPDSIVRVALTNPSPSIFDTDTDLKLTDGSHWELELEGFIETEETWPPDEVHHDAEILRGTFLPTTVRLNAVG